MEHDDLERRLTALGQQPLPPGLASEHLTRIATAGTPSRWSSKLRVGAALLAGLLLGGSGLAAAGALPDPVQHAAHEALGTVGVDVPDPERYHGDECGDEVKRNHGAYVKDDRSLAKARCGKPLGAGGKGEGGEGEGGPKDKGPCQGPPSWAGPDKAEMTPEEKAAAQAAREAQCPDAEADEAEVPEAREAEGEPEGGGAPTTTTTTVAETTTTVADPTTTTESTTTTS